MDVPLIPQDQAVAPPAEPVDEVVPSVPEPTRGERYKYDFDVWYTSSGSAEIWILVWINVFFLILLFLLFAVTGSGSGLSGFEYISEMIWMSWGQLGGKAPKAMDPDGLIWPTRAVRTFAAFASESTHTRTTVSLI
jgi:hypothetical protein